MLLAEVKEIGYADGQEAARESGSAEAPADGWDGWLINSIGLSQTCKLFGEPLKSNRHGWTKKMARKLVAYAKAAQQGAAAQVLFDAEPPEPRGKQKPRYSKTDVKSAAKTNLEKAVAAWIVRRMPDYDGRAEGVFKDLFYGGFASGIVGDLVYYNDTTAFARKHLDDIFDLAADQAGDTLGKDKNAFDLFASLNGAQNVSDGTTALNLLAWYGFEEAARQLANRLEIDE